MGAKLFLFPSFQYFTYQSGDCCTAVEHKLLKWFSSGHGFDNVLLEQTDEELSKQPVNEDYEMCEAQVIHAF